MKTLELFCGTKSFSNVAEQYGYEIFTLDNNDEFNATITIDILNFDIDMLDGYKPDIIWAIKLVKKTVEIISVLQPKYFYIENPRAMLRKLELIPFSYSTVSYCQYGFKNMKPTDIWHNNPNWAKEAKFCGKGQPCHESAPRGSKKGTQGLKNAKERARIPLKLIQEILDYSK